MADFARHYWTALPEFFKTAYYKYKGLIGRADLEEAGPVCGAALDAGGSPPRDVVFLRTEPERFSDGVVLREGLALRCRLHGGDAASKPRPVVVVIRDSAFEGAQLSARAPSCLAYLGREFLVADVEHRGYCEGGAFPVALRDVAAAVRAVAELAPGLGGDPARLCLFGSGSGAWLAAMAALVGSCGDETIVDDLLGGPPLAVAAAVCEAGPVGGFAALDAMGRAAARHGAAHSPASRFLGFSAPADPWRAARADPATYATARAPPLLLVHGADDPVWPCGQSAALHAALEAVAPGRCRLDVVAGAGHATPHFAAPPVREAELAFLRGAVGEPAADAAA